MSAIAIAAAAPPACEHCGLPVPEPGDRFCCHGCHGAWTLIHRLRLDGYYALGERAGRPARPSGRGFAEFDHPAFRERHVRCDAGLESAELDLEGVTCGSCLWLIERLPRAVPGWTRSELDLSRSRARLAWDPERVTLSAIARELDALGYRLRPASAAPGRAARSEEDRAALVQVGIAGALAISVMMVAMALYGGWFSGMEPEFEHYFRWVSLLLAAPAVLGPGFVFFRSAWTALRVRTVHMDLPIAIALSAGLARGAFNTVSGTGPIYLDGVAMLVFLLRVGRFLQQRAQRAAADASEQLVALGPAVARVVEAGGTVEVPAGAVLPGWVVEVRAGDVVPVDGVVVAGAGSLDRSLLTGESRPVPVGAGDLVFAGTVSRDASLRVRATHAGESTRLAGIARLVEESARRRPRVAQLADRWSGVLVVVTIALAAAAWWLARPVGNAAALDRAIALLVVTCPCALALATPLAIAVAIGRAARRGLLIRGGDALEALAGGGRMILDKTGTITAGLPRLVSWDGPEVVKPLVVALERQVAHPIARGFEAAWPGVPWLDAPVVRAVAGHGLLGQVAGHQVVVGSPRFVREHLPEGADPGTDADSPETVVHVALDGRLAGRAVFADPVREDAASALAALRARGWRLGLLSGDDPAVVRAVGAALGFAPGDCRGGADPEEKLAEVERATARGGVVVMVGDGVNDAAAIARATVGIAVNGGADASRSAADVAFARPGLAPLVEMVTGARRTMRAIRAGIAVSLVYNAIGVALAMSGAISPLAAAVLMPLSSISVVVAAWRVRTFEPPPGRER